MLLNTTRSLLRRSVEQHCAKGQKILMQKVLSTCETKIQPNQQYKAALLLCDQHRSSIGIQRVQRFADRFVLPVTDLLLQEQLFLR